MKICDLHSHSTYSDGSYTPEEIVKEAKKIGLSAIALTDHNTTAGLKEFQEAGIKYGIETVQGTELSTSNGVKQLHILALFLNPKNYQAVEDRTSTYDKEKTKSNITLINNLQNAGYDITFDEVQKLLPNKAFNRAHVAKVLLKKGYINSIEESFKTLLHKSNGLYIPPKLLDTCETIGFIKNLGAIPVLAHPLRNMSCEELDKFLPDAIDAGLVGMEIMHSKYSPNMFEGAKELQEKYNILPSGGSDFHGTTKPNILLGRGINNNLKIPYDFYENLKHGRE